MRVHFDEKPLLTGELYTQRNLWARSQVAGGTSHANRGRGLGSLLDSQPALAGMSDGDGFPIP